MYTGLLRQLVDEPTSDYLLAEITRSMVLPSCVEKPDSVSDDIYELVVESRSLY